MTMGQGAQRLSPPPQKGLGYFTLARAAGYLGCSKKTVRRLIGSGLPCYRLGARGHIRVRSADLDSWMEENCKVQGDLDSIVDELCEGFT